MLQVTKSFKEIKSFNMCSGLARALVNTDKLFALSLEKALIEASNKIIFSCQSKKNPDEKKLKTFLRICFFSENKRAQLNRDNSE